jgi:hypothetical protein
MIGPLVISAAKIPILEVVMRRPAMDPQRHASNAHGSRHAQKRVPQVWSKEVPSRQRSCHRHLISPRAKPHG